MGHRTTITTIIALGLSLAACSRDEVQCFFYLNSCDETTGGDDADGFGDGGDGDVWCDEVGVCLLAGPEDPLVLSLIDDGLFVPHSLGTCNEPGRTWDAFQRATPIDDGYNGRLQAACCADMGCDSVNQPTLAFSICMPPSSTWGEGGAVGAIGFGPHKDHPQCDALDPYAYAHDYTMTFGCGAVSCLDLRTGCACSCEEDSGCWPLQDQIEEAYGVDPETWELACTGYPWIWDYLAYGDGGWVGSTCEFNQPGPEPGAIPMPLVEVIERLDCKGNACGIPTDVFERIALDPALVMADTIAIPEGDTVIITECGVICSALGLDGATLTAVGPEHQPPTTSAAWRDAFVFWDLDGGSVEIDYLANGEPRSLTLYKI